MFIDQLEYTTDESDGLSIAMLFNPLLNLRFTQLVLAGQFIDEGR